MGLYANPLLIGGGGGSRHDYYAADGKVLDKIGVWAEGWQIKAIRLWRTGLPAQTAGNPSGAYREFTFKPGERITKLSLWGNGAGSRLGWIRFETNQGHKFDHGMTSWGKKQEYPIDVGSGICVGMILRSGADVDAGAFVFLNEIEASALVDVKYPTLNFDMNGITPRSLDSFQDENTSTTPRTWTFTNRHSVTTSQKWSVTAGVEVHSETHVEAGIPEVGKAGSTFGWKVSASATYERSNSETRELSWQESGTLQPGDSINLQAVTRIGRLSIDYTGTMVVKLKHGQGEFRYPVKGTYDGVAVSAVQVVDTASGAEVGSAPSQVATPAQPAELQVKEVQPV
jgi:hypothetical protein